MALGPTFTASKAVLNHAASICELSIPASARHSSYASDIKSAGSDSHRSPNFEQPIPNIATLSLMPLAILILHNLFFYSGDAFQKYCRIPLFSSMCLIRKCIRVWTPTSKVSGSKSANSTIILPPPSNSTSPK